MSIVVRCLSCRRTTNNPTGESWKLWQLCFKCGIYQHPKHYADKNQHDHGIGKLEKPHTAQSLYENHSKGLNSTD